MSSCHKVSTGIKNAKAGTNPEKVGDYLLITNIRKHDFTN